jgi:hypothetical protein
MDMIDDLVRDRTIVLIDEMDIRRVYKAVE